MGNPMRIRATLKGGNTEVRVLMSHPMETGLRKDSAGAVVPAHFITTVVAHHNERELLSAEWGAAVSQNPFLQFSFKGGAAGDKVKVSWVDNKGDTRTDEVALV